jgi:hypothetical protein
VAVRRDALATHPDAPAQAVMIPPLASGRPVIGWVSEEEAWSLIPEVLQLFLEDHLAEGTLEKFLASRGPQ